jgi:hypothetical protein
VAATASKALTSVFTGSDMVFTSFLREIAGFNSETRASCDYTALCDKFGKGDRPKGTLIILNFMKYTAL